MNTASFAPAKGEAGPRPAAGRARLFLHLIMPLGLLMLWQVASLNWPANPKYATLQGVVAAFGTLWAKGTMQMGIRMSLMHIVGGFSIAVALGSVLGLLMGYLPGMNRWLGPLVHSLRPIAPYAWIPLVILWIGIGDSSVIAIVAYAGFFPMVMNAMTGARKIDRSLIDAARVLGARPLTLFARVFLPAALPSLLVGARLAMGASWTSVVAAELTSGARGGPDATSGLGQMMFTFYAYSLNLNNIVACIIVVGALALLFDRALGAIYRQVTPWARK